MNWDLSQFHFIRPLILLAIPVFVSLWLLIKRTHKNTHWEAHINHRLLRAMRVGAGTQSQRWRWSLLVAWIITCLAAAGPTWQKQTVPTLQNQNAMVILLDLSASMLAQDLNPDRLTQAKYKLIDILRARADGQTGLIAYAGDAHTVSPLTDDPNAIEVLLPALHPSIMPVSGSNTESAVQLAMQLLNDSGISSGQILLLTDGVTEIAQKSVLAQLNQAYQLSILAIGGLEPAPIPIEGGGFLRGSNGEIVVTAPNNQQLRQLAQAAGGRYSPMRLDSSDIDYVINDEFESTKADIESSLVSTTYDAWTDMGHWLVLLLLPIAALCFRKGVFYLLPLFMVFPIDSNAVEWQDLWQTRDQQAQQLLSDNPQIAAQTFERSDWAGVANYQAKDYDAAAQKFANGDDANSHYNRGNALALNGDLEGAIAAYDQAIEKNPDFEDAIHNKQLVENLEKQQEQQEQQQNQSDENSESEDGEQQDNQESQEQDEQSSEEQKQSPESEQQDSDRQSADSEQQAQEKSDQQSSDGEEPLTDEESLTEEEKAQQETEQSQSESEQEPSATEESSDNQEPSAGEEEPSADQQELEQQAMLAEATPDQLKDSSEQWLRSINDDPSGLLRRKFQYQSWLRSQQQSPSNTTNNTAEERY